MNLHALEDAVNALVRLADATERIAAVVESGRTAEAFEACVRRLTRIAAAVESLDGKTAQVKAIDYTPRGGEADA